MPPILQASCLQFKLIIVEQLFRAQGYCKESNPSRSTPSYDLVSDLFGLNLLSTVRWRRQGPSTEKSTLKLCEQTASEIRGSEVIDEQGNCVSIAVSMDHSPGDCKSAVCCKRCIDGDRRENLIRLFSY